MEIGTGLATIRRMRERSERLQGMLVKQAFLPNEKKAETRRWPISEAAAMVGRSRQAITDAEASSRLPPPALDAKNRRSGYTLAEINRMRKLFGTRPWREDSEEPIVLAISNFKGGVAKTTVAIHLSQYLAMRGYRTLLIDMDPQASATTMFGYIPDADIKENDTILPYFRGEAQALKYAVRKTYWDGLDLIPSCLRTFDAEYEIMGGFKAEQLELLRDGIQTISHDYDVIVIDSPPALGMLSLNVLLAANALLIPVPPAMFDFYSTVSYLRMLEETLTLIEKRLGPVQYKFIRMLISRLDDQKVAHREMVEIMESTYEKLLLTAKLKDSAEINNAGVRLYTVYELDKAERSKGSRDRALKLLDTVFNEVEDLIRACWPSRSADLKARGLIT
jgi:chromosome partitioning protein